MLFVILCKVLLHSISAVFFCYLAACARSCPRRTTKEKKEKKTAAAAAVDYVAELFATEDGPDATGGIETDRIASSASLEHSGTGYYV